MNESEVRDLTREEIRELKHRAADFENPVRYAVFHSFTPQMNWKMWHDAQQDVYCSDIEHATLYKRYEHAKAIVDIITDSAHAEVVADGMSDYAIKKAGIPRRMYVAKITTKNNNIKVLKYDYYE